MGGIETAIAYCEADAWYPALRAACPLWLGFLESSARPETLWALCSGWVLGGEEWRWRALRAAQGWHLGKSDPEWRPPCQGHSMTDLLNRFHLHLVESHDLGEAYRANDRKATLEAIAQAADAAGLLPSKGRTGRPRAQIVEKSDLARLVAQAGWYRREAQRFSGNARDLARRLEVREDVLYGVRFPMLAKSELQLIRARKPPGPVSWGNLLAAKRLGGDPKTIQRDCRGLMRREVIGEFERFQPAVSLVDDRRIAEAAAVLG